MAEKLVVKYYPKDGKPNYVGTNRRRVPANGLVFDERDSELDQYVGAEKPLSRTDNIPVKYEVSTLEEMKEALKSITKEMDDSLDLSKKNWGSLI